VIAEAMAAGLPVVARNLPAYRKLYHEAPALYLLENEKDLSTKVITLLKMSADERHKIGLANKNYAKKRFSWDNVSRKILNTISSIAPYMG